MRKIKFFIITIFSLFVLVGCDFNNQHGQDEKPQYTLTVIDEYNLISNAINDKYEENSEVYFTVYIVRENYYANVYVNGQVLEPTGTISDDMVDCPYYYYEYRFIINTHTTIEVERIVHDDVPPVTCHVWDEGKECDKPILPDQSNFTYYTCQICGMESIYNSGEHNKYNVIVSTTNEDYIISELDSEYEEGTIITIKTIPIIDADVIVLVNGAEIYNCYAEFDYWEFKFIMPAEDIMITIVTDSFIYDPDDLILYSPLGMLIPWIRELELDNIDVVKTKEYDLDLQYGRFADVKYSNNESDILQFYNLKNLHARSINFGVPEYTGHYQETTVYLKDGSKHKLEFIGNTIIINGNYYSISKLSFSSNEKPAEKPIELYQTPKIEFPYLECFSIITDPTENPKLYVDDQYIGIVKNLGEVEFVLYQYDESDEQQKPGTYIDMQIITKYCTIIMNSAGIFGYNQMGMSSIKIYKIVQGMDDAPEGFYCITINPVV